MSTQKKCGTCEEEKTSSEFHKRDASIDGLAACCKECQRRYDRSRRDDPKRAEHRAEMRPKYAHKRSEYSRAWRQRNPEKYACHVTLNNAVRDGKVVKGDCEVCGSPKVDAHHDDYGKPLDVRWLCHEHHGLTRRIPDARDGNSISVVPKVRF